MTLAYESVLNLGYTHSKLVDGWGMSYPTLRKIRERMPLGARGKKIYLRMFTTILDKAYQDDFKETGGDNSTKILKAMREILLAELHIAQ